MTLHRYSVARVNVCGAAGCCGDLVLVCGEHGEIVDGGGVGRDAAAINGDLYEALDVGQLIEDHERVFAGQHERRAPDGR